MSGSRMFVAGVLIAAAWFGRGLVAPGPDSDDAPFVPIARYVEVESADLEWEPTADVRDPFVPLVLPSTPAGDAAPAPVE